MILKGIKRAVCVFAAGALALTSMAGCGRKKIELDDNEVVMTMGDTGITLSLVNFYVRYQQSLMESVYQSYLGDNVWRQQMEDGVTYEENMKETFLDNLKEFYTVYAHAAEYNVSLTEEEEKAIDEAAEAFDKANKKDVKKQISGSKENVAEYLRMTTVNKKVTDAAKAKLREAVTDEEAAQKKILYVKYDTTTTKDGETVSLSDKEVKKAKKDAAAFLKAAKENGSLEAYATEAGVTSTPQTFGDSSESPDKKVIEAAKKLGLNEFSDVIKGEDAYYVVQLTSEFDREATDTKKDSMADDQYEDLLKDWVKDAKFVLKKEVWDKISLDGLKIVTVTPEDDTDKGSDE